MTTAKQREQLRAWQRTRPGSFTSIKESAMRRGQSATQARTTARRALGEAVPVRHAVVESVPTAITPPSKPLHEMSRQDQDHYAARFAAEAVFGHQGADDEPAAEPQPAAVFPQPDRPWHTMTDEASWLHRIAAVSSSVSFGGKR